MFQETFSFSPSIRLLFIDIGSSEKTLATNRELSPLGQHIHTLQIVAGGKTYPAPALNLDMRSGTFQAARAYAEYASVVG